MEKASSAWDVIDKFRGIIYGDSGTGKTRYWSTFPGRTLALICSGSKLPGELKSVDTPENRKRIRAPIITSTQKLKTELKNAPDYDNVILDHVTGLQRMVMMEVQGLDEIPAHVMWGDVTLQDYGKIVTQTIRFLSEMLNLYSNVVFIGQERVFKGKEDVGGDNLVTPAIGIDVYPEVARWLNASVDEIYQTFKRHGTTKHFNKVSKKEEVEVDESKVEYCLRIKEHATYITKVRYTGSKPLPDAVVNPTYAKVKAILSGN